MSPSAPLDEGNLLSEILFRLPPHPSSLPRASLVSKCWLSLVSDPRSLHRFRIHHRGKPPLLGFFDRDLVFAPTLDPPNRVLFPDGRFSLQLDGDYPLSFRLIGCRHGLVLIFLLFRRKVLVWDPVTGDHHRADAPQGFDTAGSTVNGAVLRSATRHSQHFQVVLVGTETNEQQHTRATARVYSSETGLWGDIISTSLPPIVFPAKPAVLIGDSLYWLVIGSLSGILEFDLDMQRLAVIPLPVPLNRFDKTLSQYSVMRADGGGLGFLFLSSFSTELWKRNPDCDGIASWVLARTIKLDELLSLDPEKDHAVLLGLAEYNNVVLLSTSTGTFMIQLESLQFNQVPNTHWLPCHNAFGSFYPAGSSIGGGHDGAEVFDIT